MQNIFHKVESGIDGLFHGGEHHSHTHHGYDCAESHSDEHNGNRFQSFAPQTTGRAKWYVDGCSYFWAVSEALAQARETIYILDWWLSPELYLRRPPSSNEQYRLDRMLKAAAERGVQIRVIVYKEVPQALTLNSEHTKHALEALHPNIRVFRHPDHLPSGHDFQADFESAFKNMNLRTFDLSKLGKDALKTLYGTSDDVVLYWAHHEKLCVIDGHIAFMGGLDLCFGRWDTNSHPIADAHPENLDDILFPGQDYNNARVYDFEDVDKWENNKLDRTKSSRMGWSDISISLSGHIVNSLVTHFIDRWNYIFNGKYVSRNEGYEKIPFPLKLHHVPDSLRDTGESIYAGGQRFVGGIQRHLHHGMSRMLGESDGEEGGEERSRDGSHHQSYGQGHGPAFGSGDLGGVHIQLTRSCCQWSAGHKIEHSIANAYISAILNAEHFVYIENQFFITATSDDQHPVSNKIGRAIVQRIVRAHEQGDKFGMVVCIPAVPGFAGDLHADGALGTRAIMEYQYNSINRGKNSIYGALIAAGVSDPAHYLRFYNLRNYDRINTTPLMGRAEKASGVAYEDARREFDDAVESGYDGYSREGGKVHSELGDSYRRYQAGAADITRDQPDLLKTADTVSASYMDGGPDLTKRGWMGEGAPGLTGDGGDAELAAFVSEELYIHTKVLIADDRLVICGSANLNDRSQLGSHDSEIAVVIEDPEHPVHTTMGGNPYVVGAFPASLRRHLFRKHIGLLPDQRWDQPTQNFSPITVAPNAYDWDSPADRLVSDPLSANFTRLWQTTAATNTAVFDDVFHCVPSDRVRNWDQYDSYFSQYFKMPGAKEDESAKRKNKDKKEQDKAVAALHPSQDGHDAPNTPSPSTPPTKVDYGHVVPSYPGGVVAVKERLAEVRGNLVEMPLNFLIEVKDLAKEGLTLNSLTDELYT
ncbi:phospholipase D [Sporothrix brasiliensis 5110]|uniref:Phospholipase n=1 Tax=Sporothrix brasiliensis 5110 TaxID=1398154 RepID=A0A0C2FE34_9PEZI|nr:phospholipase D [Sporothrix brasiliensis 5110]KIH89408.1 phospholipase D [Sporothrix brasiliensis 5110]